MKTNHRYQHLNGRRVRFNGNIYRITANTLGTRELVSAECVLGQRTGEVLNVLLSRSTEARAIRRYCQMGLVS
jgi:hypothetical protein